MAAEQVVTPSRQQKGRALIQNLRDRFSGLASRHENKLSEKVYQTLLGTEKRIRGNPETYNIGQLSLQPRTGLDPQLYQDRELKTFEEVIKGEDLVAGIPYIACGFVFFDDDNNAVLETTIGDIHLGAFGPDATRMLQTELIDREMVLPVVLDEISDQGMRGRPGEQAAYLQTNPDFWQRQRLRRKQGQVLVEGTVAEVDPEENSRLVIQTTNGRDGSSGKQISLVLDQGRPLYDDGTEDRPTTGEPIVVGDTVLVRGEFVGRKLFMTGPAVLDEFSVEHMLSYEKKRQDIAERLHTLELVLTDTRLESVRQGNAEWHLVTQEARETVARYLFAQLRQDQHLLLPAQQEQMWELVGSMDPQAQPIIFADGDQKREVLDNYFAKMDKESWMPRLSESMTPTQLLDEMMLVAAHDMYPPALETMMGVTRDYQGNFPQDAAGTLIQYVLIGRGEQLRQGEDASSAIHTLWETLPYLREQGISYQVTWLAYLINTGGLLHLDNPKEWKQSSDLHKFMRTSLRELGLAVYPDNDHDNVNHQALFALSPYYNEHLMSWPENLPYSLGHEPVLEQILRDLGLIDMGSTWQRSLFLAAARPANGDPSKTKANQLREVLTGLRSL